MCGTWTTRPNTSDVELGPNVSLPLTSSSTASGGGVMSSRLVLGTLHDITLVCMEPASNGEVKVVLANLKTSGPGLQHEPFR